MHLVRIDKQGWDKFNGHLFGVEFKDGLSTRPLSDLEVKKIGASIRLVRVDSNEQIGPTVTMASSRHVSAEVKAPLPAAKEAPVEVELKYTKDRLEEIASEGGIKAVREIAKEFDVKGVEISKMIDDIMKKQLGTE